jgi:tetratricopeptide (TPR) repeat protein
LLGVEMVVNLTASDRATSALEEFSKLADFEFQSFYALVRAEKYEEAFDELMDEKGRIRKKYRPYENHSWYCLANVYFKTEQFADAIRYFIKAIREMPNDLQAWFALGNAYSANGNFREAANCFFVVLIVDPKYRGAVYNYSCAFMDMGEYEKALHHLKSIRDKDEKILRNIEVCKTKLSLG